MSQSIKKYWDDRAAQLRDNPQATTDDVYLRELEISCLVLEIKEAGVAAGDRVLDVGCGDGFSMLNVAREFPGVCFTGADYSGNMINIASERLAKEPDDLKKRVRFIQADATALDAVCGCGDYKVVTSDRCLINLASYDDQCRAIDGIAQRLLPGGRYVAIENFMDGQNTMNSARKQMGLPEIPVRWHNLFFTQDSFTAALAGHFENVAFKDFSSSYYFATRVIYSAMCQMRNEPPDYRHEIHQLAPRLPWFGQFSPIRMVIASRNAVRCR